MASGFLESRRAPVVPRTGMRRAIALALIAMTSFFLALTYAYVQRHTLGQTWFSPDLGLILTINTLLLLASSLALHRSGEWLRSKHPRAVGAMLRWLGAALALGIGFLAGQALAWRHLWRAGVYLGRFPNSGFFFLVTAAHAAHLLIALGLLVYLLARAWRGRLRREAPLAMDLVAMVWHTLDLTWVYLYVVLVYWR